jgi:hypothetical protein
VDIILGVGILLLVMLVPLFIVCSVVVSAILFFQRLSDGSNNDGGRNL